MEKLIITVATTGAVATKAQNPNLPEQPEEIIQAAYECWNEGASIIHIHARDKKGKSTHEPEVFREIDKGIRAKCDIIIQNTTGGGFGMTLEERLQSLEAGPEMASLDTCLLNYPLPDNKWYLASNTPSDIEYYAKTMLNKGVKPVVEVFGLDGMKEVHTLIEKGLLKKPYFIDFVMGMPAQGAMEATPKNLMFLIDILPSDSIFDVMAVGARQLPLTSMSIILGGMVRVGMEDNVYYSKGVLAESNAQLVARTVRIAKQLGREIAKPDEARKILGIPKSA